MKFNKKIYKKTYLIKAKKEVERDYNVKLDVKESGDYYIVNGDAALWLADYYIYIYNEKN